MPSSARSGRLDREFELEEIRGRGLDLAHPRFGGAGRGDVLRRNLDLLAALLVRINPSSRRPFGPAVQRSSCSCLRRLASRASRRCLNDGTICLHGSVARLHLENVVVDLERLFIGMVLSLRVAKREFSLQRVDLRKRLGSGNEVVGAVGRDAAPHWIGKQCFRGGIVAAVEGQPPLLIGSHPKIDEAEGLSRGLLRLGGHRLHRDHHG